MACFCGATVRSQRSWRNLRKVANGQRCSMCAPLVPIGSGFQRIGWRSLFGMRRSPDNIDGQVVSIETISGLLDICSPPRRLFGANAPMYRGHADSNWLLVPSLLRVSTIPDETDSWESLQRHMLLSFWSQARSIMQEPDNELERLAIAQHFGLPTSLLDWSLNPLVALYFAVSNFDDRCDAAIWELRDEKSPLSWDGPPLAAVVGQVTMHSAIWSNERIAAQQGCFTSHGLPPGRAAFAPLVPKSPGLGAGVSLTKLTVSGDAKADLRSDLAAVGITARTLFPGLDGLAASVKSRIRRQLERDSDTEVPW